MLTFFTTQKAKLNTVSLFLDKVKHIPNKNSGGCLYFCYAYLKYLKQYNLDTSSFSINQYGRNFEIERNRAYLKKQVTSAVDSYHFTWDYDGKEYDAEGIVKYPPLHPREKFSIIEYGENQIIDFCENALVYGYWNEIFNRSFAKAELEDCLYLDLKV